MSLKKCLGKGVFLFIYFFSVLGNTSIESILINKKISNNDLRSVRSIVSKKPKESIKKFLEI